MSDIHGIPTTKMWSAPIAPETAVDAIANSAPAQSRPVEANSVAVSAENEPKVTSPESEKRARMAELELHTGNQRERLNVAQKTQQFLHHDRETGLSYWLIDGSLVQGSVGAGVSQSRVQNVTQAVGPLDRGDEHTLGESELPRAGQQMERAETTAADAAKRLQETSEEIDRKLS